jgi:hypothetical protein
MRMVLSPGLVLPGTVLRSQTSFGSMEWPWHVKPPEGRRWFPAAGRGPKRKRRRGVVTLGPKQRPRDSTLTRDGRLFPAYLLPISLRSSGRRTPTGRPEGFRYARPCRLDRPPGKRASNKTNHDIKTPRPDAPKTPVATTPYTLSA